MSWNAWPFRWGRSPSNRHTVFGRRDFWTPPIPAHPGGSCQHPQCFPGVQRRLPVGARHKDDPLNTPKKDAYGSEKGKPLTVEFQEKPWEVWLRPCLGCPLCRRDELLWDFPVHSGDCQVFEPLVFGGVWINPLRNKMCVNKQHQTLNGWYIHLHLP